MNSIILPPIGQKSTYKISKNSLKRYAKKTGWLCFYTYEQNLEKASFVKDGLIIEAYESSFNKNNFANFAYCVQGEVRYIHSVEWVKYLMAAS